MTVESPPRTPPPPDGFVASATAAFPTPPDSQQPQEASLRLLAYLFTPEPTSPCPSPSKPDGTTSRQPSPVLSNVDIEMMSTRAMIQQEGITTTAQGHNSAADLEQAAIFLGYAAVAAALQASRFEGSAACSSANQAASSHVLHSTDSLVGSFDWILSDSNVPTHRRDEDLIPHDNDADEDIVCLSSRLSIEPVSILQTISIQLTLSGRKQVDDAL